jgi:hypothetical protein
MAITAHQENPALTVLRLSGLLRKAELEAAQAIALKAIESAGKIKTLVLLENFAGWLG